jgi:hypothetical protein
MLQKWGHTSSRNEPISRFHRKGLIIKGQRSLEIEREIELIFPAKFEARFADGVVAVLRTGMSPCEVGGPRTTLS